MRMTAYPQGGFGNTRYEFSASFDMDDFQHYLSWPSGYEDMWPVALKMLSRYVGIEYRATRCNRGVQPPEAIGTFPRDMFVPETDEERRVYAFHGETFKALTGHANVAADDFIQRFYDSEVFHDNSHAQSYRMAPRWKAAIEPIPYQPPMDTWHPQVQQAQPAPSVQYIPVTPYNPQV